MLLLQRLGLAKAAIVRILAGQTVRFAAMANPSAFLICNMSEPLQVVYHLLTTQKLSHGLKIVGVLIVSSDNELEDEIEGVEEEEEGEEDDLEYFDIFPIMEELGYHEWLLKILDPLGFCMGGLEKPRIDGKTEVMAGARDGMIREVKGKRACVPCSVEAGKVIFDEEKPGNLDLRRREEKSLIYNTSFLGEYECSSLALDRRRKKVEDGIGSLETRFDNVSDQEIYIYSQKNLTSPGSGLGGGEGFLEKFERGFEQDIDEQDEKKKRSGEDDEEIRICCGLNNG
ncbi:hypothetical protein Tco_0616080 [Tanacetum coccineum]